MLLNNNQKAFFELTQVALGNRKKLSHSPSEEEWSELFLISQSQAVIGVIYSALDRLTIAGQKPALSILYDWIGMSEQIKQRNLQLNHKCLELTKLFEDNGFQCCILKGQGNALMYPEPLLRTSGDIDIWIKGDREDIIKFCKSRVEKCKVEHHHIEFPIWNDVEVEVHTTPSFTWVPRFAKRTKDYFEQFAREEIEGRGLFPNGSFYVPTMDMNMVFQMSHMSRHFFYEGLGMRQLVDYYYLLEYTSGKVDRDKVVDSLKYLNLDKFTGGIMWVLKEVLGMDEKYLLIQPDPKRGKLILDEIMKTGNFGQYDQRVSAKIREKSTTMSAIARNIRFLCLFPEEAFWAPIVQAWHYLKYRES